MATLLRVPSATEPAPQSTVYLPMLFTLLLACSGPNTRQLDRAQDKVRLPPVDPVPSPPGVAEPTTVLHVTPQRVSIDARALRERGLDREAIEAAAQPIELASAETRGLLLMPLYEQLNALSGRERELDGGLTGRVRLRVDRDASWELVQQALYTSGQAMYSEFQLAVTGPGGEVAVPVWLPAIGGMPIGPRLAIDSEGLTLVPVLSAVYWSEGEPPKPRAIPCRAPACEGSGERGLEAYVDAAAFQEALESLGWPPAARPGPGLQALSSGSSLSFGLAPAPDAPWALVAATLPQLASAAEAHSVPLVVVGSQDNGPDNLVGPECSAAASFERRQHLDLERLDQDWLAVADPLVHSMGGAVVGHAPSTTLTAWTPWPERGFIGVFACHGLEPHVDLGRAVGDQQVLVLVGPDGAVEQEFALGHQGCCGHTWWSELKLSIDGDQVVVEGHRELASDQVSGPGLPPPPPSGPAREVFPIE